MKFKIIEVELKNGYKSYYLKYKRFLWWTLKYGVYEQKIEYFDSIDSAKSRAKQIKSFYDDRDGRKIISKKVIEEFEL